MIVRGVFHYRAPQGRNPPLVLSTVDTSVIFWGEKQQSDRGSRLTLAVL